MQKKKSRPLDGKVADRLLELLSTDDQFRQDFRANPQAALRSIGYQPQSETAPAGTIPLEEPFSSCEVDDLATKEAIRQSLDELRSTLVQGLSYTTPTFEAKNISGSKTRK